jgi:hypothetical protein
MRTRLKLSTSWLIVALGCLVGLLACVGLGLVHVSLLESSNDGHLAWFGIAWIALIGLTFLIGSIVALQNRRLAGLIFLSVMPVAALCLAYASSAASLPSLVAWSIAFLLFGLFWLRTGTRGWPLLVQTRSWSPRKRASALAATCVTILFLDVALTVILIGLGSSLFSGDCSGRKPFLHPLFPNHAVFTARVVFAARSINALTESGYDPRPSGPDRAVGDWAIGIVEERFWGMPLWTRFVLLTNHVYWEGETYFVDGLRFEGLLTRFFPIVEGGAGCTRTMPVQDAIVDLRLLRTPPPPGSTRVMGYVRGPEVFTPVNARPRKPAFVAGATIDVTGPFGSSRITSDSAGLYELNGLAPGDYTLQLSTPDTQTVRSFFQNEGSPTVIHLDTGGVVQRDFVLLWDGRIEGKVSDDSGVPARALVELLSADAQRQAGYASFSEMTAADGSYQFRPIPEGRYLVVVNPYGPDNERPYDIQYYPRAVRKENAQVLELANGQRLSGISFRTPRLAERSTQVRVTRADGAAAAGARVCFAYENADDYEALAGSHCKDVDQDGLAVIRIYGRSQVRIVATQSADGDDRMLPDRFRSQPVQYAADQIPNTVNLVLNFVKP